MCLDRGLQWGTTPASCPQGGALAARDQGWHGKRAPFGGTPQPHAAQALAQHAGTLCPLEECAPLPSPPLCTPACLPACLPACRPWRRCKGGALMQPPWKQACRLCSRTCRSAPKPLVRPSHRTPNRPRCSVRACVSCSREQRAAAQLLPSPALWRPAARRASTPRQAPRASLLGCPCCLHPRLPRLITSPSGPLLSQVPLRIDRL